MDALWLLVGSMAALLTMFGFVPQVYKMFRTKSVKDVSVVTLIQFNIGVFCWMLYGIHLKDFIIISANGITFFTLIIALIIYFKLAKLKDI